MAETHSPRSIGLVSAGRSDWGIYAPILQALRADDRFRVRVWVAGEHLKPGFGHLVAESAVEPVARIDSLPRADTAEAVAEAMGRATAQFAPSFAAHRPALLLLLGDRYEMFAAAAAAVPLALPLAHIHGGEITEGAMDEQFRHALTKMSHLHFTATDLYRRRLLAMGEEDWRVRVSGAPALDNIRTLALLDKPELAAQLGCALDPAPVVATFHPVTREQGDEPRQVREFLQALETLDRPCIFTAPNADMGGTVIAAALRDFVARHPACRLFNALGARRYFSLLKHAAAMVGNSSSGIIEAASFQLPVVNIGSRQAGRLRPPNVLDVPCEALAIRQALDKALGAEFRATLAGLQNPYGDGHAAERIVSALWAVPLDDKLLRKKFVDHLPPEACA